MYGIPTIVFAEDGCVEANVLITTNFAGQEITTEGKASYFTVRESTLKALKSLGICWVVGVLCIAVPILHFVLTPAALLAGPVAAILVYFKTQKLPKRLSGTVECLHCKTNTSFLFENAKPPLYEMCKNCRTGYEVLWPPKKTV